jgi:hypothetical protein
MHHRQHRQLGVGVLLRPIQRQRPEMRRRPHEDDEEQQPGLPGVCPVTAAQPSTGGMAPEAPPMTMFCGVSGFRITV